jgi:hypothetical protein
MAGPAFIKQALRGFGPAKQGRLAERADEARYNAQQLFDQQDTGYFDLSGTLENPGHTADFALPRYEPPRGAPASLDRLDPRTSGRLLDTTIEGMNKGAHGWYNTEPLAEEFTRVLGPEKGRQEYERYLSYVAATSPRSNVRMNIMRGSIPYMRTQQGKSNVGLTNPASETYPNPGPEDMRFPLGWGHMAHNLHTGLINEVDVMGSLNPIDRPKVSSFAQNLMGNYSPMTLDTHNRAALFPQDVQPNKKGEMIKKSPSKGEYGFLEEYQGELGGMLGLDPAQFQSSLWTGGAADTGVVDAKNFMQILNESMRDTAKKHGISEREASEAFIRGEIPLSSTDGIDEDLAKQMLMEQYA